MTVGRVLSLFALLVPPSIGWGLEARVEASARSLGATAGSALTTLCPAPAPDGPLAPDAVSGADVAVPGEQRALSAFASRGGRSRGHGTLPRHGLVIGAATVLRLSRAFAVPSGRPVPESAARPAGIELSGVSSLGVGLRDGDVLTEVSGHAVHAGEQVVALVVDARRRRAGAMTAVFYRGAEPWALVVEMPYLER